MRNISKLLQNKYSICVVELSWIVSKANLSAIQTRGLQQLKWIKVKLKDDYRCRWAASTDASGPVPTRWRWSRTRDPTSVCCWAPPEPNRNCRRRRRRRGRHPDYRARRALADTRTAAGTRAPDNAASTARLKLITFDWKFVNQPFQSIQTVSNRKWTSFVASPIGPTFPDLV